MWSKTKQILESHLPENLKGRVKFHYDVYKNGSSEAQVLSILVDDEVWFCTNPKFYDELYKREQGYLAKKEDALAVIKQFGHIDNTWGDAMKYVHQMLNVLSIEEAFNHENYFIRLLALLDKRLGKRRIEKMDVDNEPEWFKKWIKLRLNTVDKNPRI